MSDLFIHSELLWLLLLALGVLLVGWWSESRRERTLRRMIGPRHRVLTAERSPLRRRLRVIVAALGVLAASLAALGPAGGVSDRNVEQRGVDIVVCLDVSRSMLARDQAPTRLAAAQQEIRSLAERARGERLALVLFAGEARLSVPLTQDLDSFVEIAELADPYVLEKGGTDLGAALETALAALVGRTGEHETILLLTDGEDLEGRGLRVAETCRERGIRVHCLGFGSVRGGKITLEGEDGETFLTDDAGQEVVTALDPGSLRRIADATGGEFVYAASLEDPLAALYEKRVLPMARRAFDSDRRNERENLYAWPLAAALLLWLLELALGDRRHRRAATVSIPAVDGRARV
ncbi:MAG: VWA domain-containing protein [Planctomycetota bacterium]